MSPRWPEGARQTDPFPDQAENTSLAAAGRKRTGRSACRTAAACGSHQQHAETAARAAEPAAAAPGSRSQQREPLPPPLPPAAAATAAAASLSARIRSTRCRDPESRVPVAHPRNPESVARRLGNPAPACRATIRIVLRQIDRRSGRRRADRRAGPEGAGRSAQAPAASRCHAMARQACWQWVRPSASSNPAAIQAGRAAVYRLPSSAAPRDPMLILAATKDLNSSLLRSSPTICVATGNGSWSAWPASTRSKRSGRARDSASNASRVAPISWQSAAMVLLFG